MDKVLVYYTGGTIGMKRNDEGTRVPDPDFENNLDDLFANLPVDWDFKKRDPLLDSSNMTPKDWLAIAEDIQKDYDRYKSFVVLHGTDTMAYTTSAMAFMLSELKKPVIFTGSQVPLAESNNDAARNLIETLTLAGNFPLQPEVCLYFKEKLLRGCRATKVSAEDFDAFDSPNFPALWPPQDGDVAFHAQVPVSPDEGIDFGLSVREVTEPRVALLRFFPGISATITRNFLQPPLEGAVLHAYGSGNGPTDGDFRDVLKEAAHRGVLVACTQCLVGSVDLSLYETGLGCVGVVSGYDMTVEAALTKLLVLLSTDLPLPTIRTLMELSLVGELTRPQEAPLSAAQHEALEYFRQSQPPGSRVAR